MKSAAPNMAMLGSGSKATPDASSPDLLGVWNRKPTPVEFRRTNWPKLWFCGLHFYWFWKCCLGISTLFLFRRQLLESGCKSPVDICWCELRVTSRNHALDSQDHLRPLRGLRAGGFPQRVQTWGYHWTSTTQVILIIWDIVRIPWNSTYSSLLEKNSFSYLATLAPADSSNQIIIINGMQR